MTSQRRWQLKKAALGLCTNCGKHPQARYRTKDGRVKTSPRCAECLAKIRWAQPSHSCYASKPIIQETA